MKNINKLLKELHIDAEGSYDNHFYVIKIENSNEYAKTYSLLDKYAVNREYPEFTKNTTGSTMGVTSYFELTLDGTEYSMFLIADFKNDEYKLKIKENN